MGDPRGPFPMLDGPSIPWATAEIIYEAYEGCGHHQPLERIAERGGFGWAEVSHLFKELKRRKSAFASDLIAKSRAGQEEGR